MEYLIGTGGWGYFNVGSKSPLRAYSKVFNFVEVNYTFYKYPTLNTIEGWRRSVPNDFTFSVRCHQDLTHRIGFKPVDEAFEVLYKMKAYCKALEAPILLLETPASQDLDQQGLTTAKDFFSTITLNGIRLAWDYRAPLTQKVAELMVDLNIVQSIDLSIQPPTFENDITYSRLFGKGKHNRYQFTDNELLKIEERTRESGSKRVILAYHGQRMYSDAARSRMHIATGKFLPVTDYLGVDSARAVLAEDAAFPSTKAHLIEDQGWKVIDMTADKKVHLCEVLDRIPDKTYSSLDEVTKELKTVL